MSRGLTAGLFGAACLAAGGCGAKLNVTKSFSLPDENGYAFILVADPQSRDQKVTVTVEATGDPVDLFVMKKADLPAEYAMVNEADKKGMEAKALGSARGTKSATVTCTVPANTEYRVVVLLGGKVGVKSQGTVKLTN